jgi:citronellol/citronellal dehydrogenase
MFQSNLFQGKTALVTGGGSGIGLEIARQLLQLGAEVYIASRKPERLEQGMAELQALGTVHSYQLDIREPEQIVGLADLIAEKSGKLDILVNNAGGQFPSLAEEISPKGLAGSHQYQPEWHLVHDPGHGQAVFLSAKPGHCGQYRGQ